MPCSNADTVYIPRIKHGAGSVLDAGAGSAGEPISCLSADTVYIPI